MTMLRLHKQRYIETALLEKLKREYPQPFKNAFNLYF